MVGVRPWIAAILNTPANPFCYLSQVSQNYFARSIATRIFGGFVVWWQRLSWRCRTRFLRFFWERSKFKQPHLTAAPRISDIFPIIFGEWNPHRTDAKSGKTSWIHEVYGIVICVVVTTEALRIDNRYAAIVGIRTGPSATQVLILAPPGMIQTCRVITFRQAVLLPIRVGCAIALGARAKTDA